VYSILDKYLEHSRIIIFANGGDEKYFLSSADWMIRNLDNRIEVATPVYDNAIQQELKEFLMIQFNDSKKARVINYELDNPYRNDGVSGPRCQVAQYNVLKKRLNS